MEAARLTMMGYKSKLGGSLSNKNQNPKKMDIFLALIKSYYGGGGSIAAPVHQL